MARKLQSLSAAKSQILDGDGAYYRAAVSWVSRAISVAGRGIYSHVGTFLWLDGELFIHECREGYGCRLVLAEREVQLYPGRIDWHRTNAPDYTMRLSVRRRALQKLGKMYDWRGVFQAGCFHVAGLRWLVQVDTEDTAISGPNAPEHCSYCRADLWDAAGFDIVPHLANRLTEPNDLARSAVEVYQCTLQP